MSEMMLAGVDWPKGPNHLAVEETLDELRKTGALDRRHAGMVSVALTLADSLDATNPKRGSSVALVAAQLMGALDRLEQLQPPAAEGAAEEYTVVLVPVDEDEDAG